jgi:hypothetical protein
MRIFPVISCKTDSFLTLPLSVMKLFEILYIIFHSQEKQFEPKLAKNCIFSKLKINKSVKNYVFLSDSIILES